VFSSSNRVVTTYEQGATATSVARNALSTLVVVKPVEKTAVFTAAASLAGFTDTRVGSALRAKLVAIVPASNE
jgi:hypothetical protein